MKIYRLYTIVLVGAFAVSCTDSLNNELSDINITVATNDAVTIENNIINVPRNTPVKFVITGEPDNITFFSGESGHNYDYRKRTIVEPNQIKSSKMTFEIETQYSSEDAYKNLFNMYMSKTFPGILKTDFEADCKTLSEFTDWQDWIPQTELPTKAEKKQYSIDFNYIEEKTLTLAIHYHPTLNTAVQPKINIRNFKIVNELNSGGVVEQYVGDMGFTPVNVWISALTDEQLEKDIKKEDLQKNEGYYDTSEKLIRSSLEYGTVTNNIWGMWNMQDAASGYIYLHSTEAGKALRESWLVSNYIVVNKCTPDTGTPVKNITNRLESYEYTYDTVGTYKAVFVLSNANYKEEDDRTITMIINVK